MKQLPFYKYATWILLLLNLAIVGFFFFTRPPAPHGGDGKPPLRAIDILEMNDEQHRDFLASVKRHEERLDAINKEQSGALLPYFRSITIESDTTNYDSALIRVQALERAKIESLFQHFQELKDILRADQQAAFKAFVEDIVEKNLLGKNQKPHPPMGSD
jgi:hypothetical protein